MSDSWVLPLIDIVTDLVTAATVATTPLPADPPPPREPQAAVWAEDCMTTRAGIEMTCSAATAQDIANANEKEKLTREREEAK